MLTFVLKCVKFIIELDFISEKNNGFTTEIENRTWKVL